MADSKKPLRPGQTVPVSGQYGVVNGNGTKTGNEITGTKGEPLPPTPRPNMGYVLNDKTKHKSGK